MLTCVGDVCCLLFAARVDCALFAMRCLLIDVWYALCVVVLVVVCVVVICLLIVVCCLLFAVGCLCCRCGLLLFVRYLLVR